MTVGPIQPGLRILPADVSPSASQTGGVRSGQSDSFGDQLRKAVSGSEVLGQDAAYKVANLVTENGGDVHDAMIAMQKADLSFQLMLQVRNKVVAAYQEIERLQF